MKDAGKKRNRVVPVASRRTPGTSGRPGIQVQPAKLSAPQTLILVVVLILLLLGIALPLRNYFQQRSDIAATQAAIAAKEKRKEELLGELDKYNSEAYIEEQARNRLGVVKEGETAFRIIDPAMEGDTSVTSTDDETAQQSDAWYVTVWRSIAEPAVSVDTQDVDKQEQPQQNTQLPIETTEPPAAP